MEATVTSRGKSTSTTLLDFRIQREGRFEAALHSLRKLFENETFYIPIKVREFTERHQVDRKFLQFLVKANVLAERTTREGKEFKKLDRFNSITPIDIESFRLSFLDEPKKHQKLPSNKIPVSEASEYDRHILKCTNETGVEIICRVAFTKGLGKEQKIALLKGIIKTL